MKLKELLEKVEELSKLTTGELRVNLACDCGIDKDIDLKSQSSKPKLDIAIHYPGKK